MGPEAEAGSDRGGRSDKEPSTGDAPPGGTSTPGGSSNPDEEGPIGPFPDWTSVYGTVLVYGVAMILFLWLMTRVLDPGAAP